MKKYIVEEGSWQEACNGIACCECSMLDGGACRIGEYIQKQPIYVEAEIDTTKDFAQWIPCSERLPKKIGVYLVTTEEGKVFEYDYNILTVHLKKWSFCRKEIVAWMPLPEPYKKEGENK